MRHTSLTKTTLILLLAAILILFTSCQSIPKDVPEDLTEADLIQLAQDSYEEGNIKAAEFYYETIIERFADNQSACIIAQFEIAHIRIKEGNFKDARPLLEDIIESFDENPELAYMIPEYLKLARLDLAKCE